MKIGIYQSYWGTIGGAQSYIGALAETLSREHHVEISHHHEAIDKSKIESMLQLDLTQVQFRYLPGVYRPFVTAGSPLGRIKMEREWSERLSAGYDLFIYACDAVPSACRAAKGVLLPFFPFETFDVFYGTNNRKPPLQQSLRRFYARQDWKHRFRTYDLTVTISEFSKRWLQLLWGVEAKIVYPCIRPGFNLAAKRDQVVSVGRFEENATGNSKKQHAMIEAYKQLCEAGLKGWEYRQLGSLPPDDQDYYQKLVAAAQRYPIKLMPNVSSEILKTNLETSKIFWHATGFGEDENQHPKRMEHFGITTVEAMAAGCVPVVINKGGQPEIVQHGVNGFLWNTLEELTRYTSKLMRDEPLRASLAQAARERAACFRREKFDAEFLKVLQPLLHSS